MQQVVDVMVLAAGGCRGFELDRDVTDAVLVVGNVLYSGTEPVMSPLIRGVDDYVCVKASLPDVMVQMWTS